MAKNADVGLKQLSNGNWAYRVTYTRDGKKTDSTIRLDSNGQPFKRKIDAKRAREQKLIELREAEVVPSDAADCRLQEIWDAYLKKSATGKAPTTIKKYSS